MWICMHISVSHNPENIVITSIDNWHVFCIWYIEYLEPLLELLRIYGIETTEELFLSRSWWGTVWAVWSFHTTLPTIIEQPTAYLIKYETVIISIFMALTRLAIIGTAGRFPQLRARLTDGHMAWMCETIESYIELVLGLNPSSIILVSGGSAWADHTAIQLFNSSSKYAGLQLYLPSMFNQGNKCFGTDQSGARLNELHTYCSTSLGTNTLHEIAEALTTSAKVQVIPGFLPRNRAIASNCDHMLAFTFDSDCPRSGGTSHTWNLTTVPKTHFNLSLAE